MELKTRHDYIFSDTVSLDYQMAVIKKFEDFYYPAGYEVTIKAYVEEGKLIVTEQLQVTLNKLGYLVTIEHYQNKMVQVRWDRLEMLSYNELDQPTLKVFNALCNLSDIGESFSAEAFYIWLKLLSEVGQ